MSIDHLWKEFTTKFNEAHNLTGGDAKPHVQMKEFYKKVSDEIFKDYGGEKDFNYKKDMPPIATLVFNMKQERDEAVEKYDFVQRTIQSNKAMIKKGKSTLAAHVLGESEENSNPNITVPDRSQKSTRLYAFTKQERDMREPIYKKDGDEEDEDSSSDYKDGDEVKKDIDPAGNSVTRFPNGHIAMNPNNKAQNGKLIADMTMMIMILLMMIYVI